MNRKLLRSIVPVLLCVLGCTKAQADPERQIRVELELGRSYGAALGREASAGAKQIAEAALVKVLGDNVKYFSFVPSSEHASHTLTFLIDHPTPDQRSTGVSLFDYYVFLEFKKNNSNVSSHKIRWLFRDAASNLNGVDSPETIAEDLSRAIKNQYNHTIIREMLSNVSFTEKARFKFQGAKGWIIEHSRHSLCMAPDSEVIVESIVPQEGFEESYSAEVKRRQSGDDVSTFTKATENVDALMTDPENARVVAVYVRSYEAECETILVESSPEMVTFGEGGGQ